MTDRTPRPGEQHPEEWRQDLNPEANAGQNYGEAGAHAQQAMRSVADIRELQGAFQATAPAFVASRRPPPAAAA